MRKTTLKVLKRDGKSEEVQFDKITKRISFLCDRGGFQNVDVIMVTQEVIKGMVNNMHTASLDDHASEVAVDHVKMNPEYEILASHIQQSNLEKNIAHHIAKKLNVQTFDREWEKSVLTFSSIFTHLLVPSGRIKPSVISFVDTHKSEIDALSAEYDVLWNPNEKETYLNTMTLFAYRTLQKSYLYKVNASEHLKEMLISERPQDMLMRVALGLHAETGEGAMARVEETFRLFMEKAYTHATPTLFNMGFVDGHLASCFLIAMREDSLQGIYQTLADCAMISKGAGGIGLSIHQIRADGSPINGTNGISKGIVPMIKVFDSMVRHVDQGGGKRKGALAFYLEPWHWDVEEYLDVRNFQGTEELRARAIFTALWVNDLFMKRVKEKGTWTLFSPDDVNGLEDFYGEEFERLYEKYEKDEKIKKRVIKATYLKAKIVRACVETGTPYILFKDACNRKSNHNHLGTIRSSNLCTEIIQYTKPGEEVAVCNLASISLPYCVKRVDGRLEFDVQRLIHVAKVVTRNLNLVIDVNAYPLKEAEVSNRRHRPIGIGVQGLADLFAMLRLPFTSAEARDLNTLIFEAIYFGALDASCELAQEVGPYPSYEGCAVSRGILQQDMWELEGHKVKYQLPNEEWLNLRMRIKTHGVRNSLLVAPMPTQTTSQILGNNECFEPFHKNIYSRRVLSGEFMIVNKHLSKWLDELGLWDEEMQNEITKQKGSIQAIERIPVQIREVFKTIWEIDQKHLLEMAITRAWFIDQAQSLNFHHENASKHLWPFLMMAWENGSKNGVYYIRTTAAVDAVQVTVPNQPPKDFVCHRNADCDSCGS